MATKLNKYIFLKNQALINKWIYEILAKNKFFLQRKKPKAKNSKYLKLLKV